MSGAAPQPLGARDGFSEAAAIGALCVRQSVEPHRLPDGRPEKDAASPGTIQVIRGRAEVCADFGGPPRGAGRNLANKSNGNLPYWAHVNRARAVSGQRGGARRLRVTWRRSKAQRPWSATWRARWESPRIVVAVSAAPQPQRIDLRASFQGSTRRSLQRQAAQVGLGGRNASCRERVGRGSSVPPLGVDFVLAQLHPVSLRPFLGLGRVAFGAAPDSTVGSGSELLGSCQSWASKVRKLSKTRA
ncbi:hypothetical protein GGTG_08110 [Gaeumannomyces tritici R3-111a-1]|uniref:Uncharacterized protein n=1 Tax=Gaeumannomyces tritici (strain R3-111a-1) TaxID=644352 RepID=J3P3M3_GAET3|nr:hypothetical protein GGTG_08110 [Gaeumannomyces tritici R3-111a-1]EJT74267.1 hypothetical protein GGTG_08110 [Gaeumannomyces tritici R3-111a-1]